MSSLIEKVQPTKGAAATVIHQSDYLFGDKGFFPVTNVLNVPVQDGHCDESVRFCAFLADVEFVKAGGAAVALAPLESEHGMNLPLQLAHSQNLTYS